MKNKIIQTVKIAIDFTSEFEGGRKILYMAKFIEAYKRLYPSIKNLPPNMQFETVRETLDIMSDYVSHCFDVLNNNIGVDKDNETIIATYSEIIESIELPHIQKELMNKFQLGQ